MKLSFVVSVEETAFDAVAIRGGWEEAAARLAALGFDGIELAIRDPAALDAGRVEAIVRRAGLIVPAIGTGQAYLRDRLSLSSVDDAVRRAATQRLLGHVRLAARLRSLVIIGLIRGRLDGGRAATTDRFLQALGPVVEAAGDAGVRLVIEPVNRYETDFLVNVGETLEVIDACGAPHLGVLADTFHMNIEEATIEGALTTAAPRLWHVHVTDSNRHAPGLGHLDFGRLLATLKEIGYPGHLSAEIMPHPDPHEAARLTAQHLRALVAPLVERGPG
ncbi:MAG: 5-keto-L-gluconate epimerase [bacterium]